MAIRKFSIAEPGVKSNKLWDQDTAQGVLEPIAQIVARGTSSNMDFYNIPSTYRDLMLVINATTNTGTAGNILLNYASFGTYSGTYIRANGSSATSNRVTSAGAGPQLSGISYNSTTPITTVIHFPNYSNTSSFKVYHGKTSADLNGSGEFQMFTCLWQKTEAIYEIALSTGNASIFWSGTATLYGIKVRN